MLDIIIIGGGPAGLSAAIYAKRAGLDALVLDKGASECQLAKAAEVENYLGFPSINGIDLHAKFTEHAKSSDIKIIKKGVVSLEKSDNGFIVKTKKDEFCARHVILAMGRSHKHLDVLGEDRLSGAGVSYCATCDGFFFKDKTVCVVGGGDSALTQAIYLSSICKKVYLIHRRNEFRGAKYLVDRASQKDNIEFVLNATINEIIGDTSVTGVNVNLNASNELFIDCDGVFGAIGETPNLKFDIPNLALTANGHIKTGNYCNTSIEGLYAIGDIREKEVYQIVTAVSDGAIVIEGILKDNY